MHRNHLIGRRLICLGGFFPLAVGTYFYLQAIWSYFQTTAFLEVTVIRHIGYANLMMTGLLTILLAHFGLRSPSRWVWWSLLAIALWTGGNDSVAMIILTMNQPENNFPVPLIPTFIELVGLWLVAKEVK